MHFIYKQKFYHDKQDEIDILFDEYNIPLLNDIDHTANIEEWKRNIDAAAYEFILKKRVKLPSKKKKLSSR